MHTPAQLSQNDASVIEIARLADNLAAQCDKRVGCEHNSVPARVENRQCFSCGVGDSQLA
jgi:hypothetical protein